MRTCIAVCLVALAMGSCYAPANQVAAQDAPSMCKVIRFDGQAVAGKTWSRPLGLGLVFVLEATETGWTMAINGPDATDASNPADYMGIATPPYHFNDILTVDASYGNTVQQTVKRSPREFHFALNESQYREIFKNVNLALYSEGSPKSTERDKAAEFIDSRLAAVTGNGKLIIKSFRLGRPSGASQDAILSMDFAVELHVPATFSTRAENAVDASHCGR